MKAYKLRGKLLAGMDMIIEKGKHIGWKGSLLQWQVSQEYEKMVVELFKIKQEFRNIWLK